MEKLTAEQIKKIASDLEFVTAAMECMVVMDQKGEGDVALPLLHEAITRTLTISNHLQGLPGPDEVGGWTGVNS